MVRVRYWQALSAARTALAVLASTPRAASATAQRRLVRSGRLDNDVMHKSQFVNRRHR